MIQIHDKFVEKYFSKKFIGKHPGFFSYLFKDDSYKKYKNRISNISEELSKFSNGAKLVPYIAKKYDFPIKKARIFVNENVTYNWKKGNKVDKKCILIHANTQMKKSCESLEKCLNKYEKN